MKKVNECEKKNISYQNLYGPDSIVSYFNNNSISLVEKQKRAKTMFAQYFKNQRDFTGPIGSSDAADFQKYFDDSINIPLGKYKYPTQQPKRLCYTSTWIDLNVLDLSLGRL